MNKKKALIPEERIINKIYLIRGRKIMFDFDLAELYGVETRVFNQAVKRNKERFPEDFMFQLNGREIENWRSQIVISNPNYKMGLRYQPYVFTEQGVVMLSSVLKSKMAIETSIAVARVFVKLREIISTNKELREKLEKMEMQYNKQFRIVLTAIKQLMEPKDDESKDEMGFKS